MMKRILWLGCLILIGIMAFAQSYEVKNVLELKNDLTARHKEVKDENGVGCALVRINAPSVNGIYFDQTIVGKPEYLPGEYNVYIPEHTPSLSMEIDGEKKEIVFANYGITIESKKCYRTTLTLKKSSVHTGQSVKVTANYDNMIVMVDGIPVGQTPLEIDNVTPGKHLLSVPNTSGFSMKDTIVDFSTCNSIHLNLYPMEYEEMEIAYTPSGGDGEGSSILGVTPIRKNGKEGLMDYTGKILVPCEFDYVNPEFYNGCYIVGMHNSIYGDRKIYRKGLYKPGEGLIQPCIYDVIFTASTIYENNDYTIVREGDRKYSFLSPEGETLISTVCYKLEYSDGMVVAEKPGGEEGYEVYDIQGRKILSANYRSLTDFHEGFAIYRKFNNEEGIIDKEGNELPLPNNYRILQGGAGMCNGRIAVKDRQTGKWGYMDNRMNLVIPAIYDPLRKWDDALSFMHGVTMLKLNEDKVLIDTNGKVIVSCRERGYKDMCLLYHDNRFPYSRYGGHERMADHDIGDSNLVVEVEDEQGHRGMLNLKGETIVPCTDGVIQWFVDHDKNYFAINNGTEITVITDQREELFRIPASLKIHTIYDGIVRIEDEESQAYGYLNTKGEVLASCVYGLEGNGLHAFIRYQLHPISEGLALLSIGDRSGFIDCHGKVRVPLIYTAATTFENGKAYVRDQEGKWKIIKREDI